LTGPLVTRPIGMLSRSGLTNTILTHALKEVIMQAVRKAPDA